MEAGHMFAQEHDVLFIHIYKHLFTVIEEGVAQQQGGGGWRDEGVRGRKRS